MTSSRQNGRRLKAAGTRPAVAVTAAVFLAFCAPAADARDRFERLDLNRDGVITLPDLLAVSDRRIKRMDTSGDGAVSRDEFMVYLRSRARRRVEMVFRRLDRNNDGRITAAEAGGRDARLRRADINNDGVVTRAEMMESMRRRALQWQSRIFGRFDTDKNGLISREERLAATKVRFRQLDHNNDGSVTRQEFDLARERWRKRRSK